MQTTTKSRIETGKRPELLRAAHEGKARFFVQFGGQGGYFLSDLERLQCDYDCIRPLIEASSDAIRDLFARTDVRERRNEIYPHGFDLRDWLRGRNIPPEDYLYNCQISFAGNLVAQLAYLSILWDEGFNTEELLRYTRGATGHSQGIVGAIAFGLCREKSDLLQVAYDFVHWFACSGFIVASRYSEPALSKEILSQSFELDSDIPKPMASLGGILADQLEELIARYKQTAEDSTVGVSLHNSHNSHVITGFSNDIAKFRAANYEWMKENDVLFTYVPVSAPFHRKDLLKDVYAGVIEDTSTRALPYTGKDLLLPVISFKDGRNLQQSGKLSFEQTDLLLNSPLDWPLTIQTLSADKAITHVIDFGPSQIATFLTRTALGVQSKQVISLASKNGIQKILNLEINEDEL